MNKPFTSLIATLSLSIPVAYAIFTPKASSSAGSVASATVASPASPSSPGAATSQVTAPSAEFLDIYAPAVVLDVTGLGGSDFEGRVRYSPISRTIDFTWHHRDSQNQPMVSVQEEIVRFWPTAVSSYGTDALLVAGKSSYDGSILIEKWTISPPSPFPAAQIDVATGDVIEPTIKYNATGKSLVFKSSSKDPVYRLFNYQGVANTAMVQFWGDWHLYALDVSSGATSVIMSVDSSSSTHSQEPSLALSRQGHWSRNHAVEGYIYFMGNTDQEHGLFLFDTDRDGQLDSHSTLTYQQYWDTGLDDLELYTEFF